MGILCRHLQQATARHAAAAHRVLRYLRGTHDRGLTFSSKTTQNVPLSLQAFCDSDWAQCPDSRRSTTGIVFTFAGGPIHWVSSKQATVAHSSAKAEYIAAAHAARDLTWLTQLARAWHIHLHDPPQTPLARPYELRIDNKGALDMARQWTNEMHQAY